MLWQVEELLEELRQREKKNQVFSFRVDICSTERVEDYFIQNLRGSQKSLLDQSRKVNDLAVYVKCSVKKDDKRIGSSRAPFYQSRGLREQLDKLIHTAEMSSEELWRLSRAYFTGQPHHVLQHAGLKNNLVQGAKEVRAALEKAVEGEKRGEFNSAELFIANQSRRIYLSSGFTGFEERSQIYAEVCFSARNGQDSDEFLVCRMGAHPEQLNFKSMCEESVVNAQAMLTARKPEPGKYAVLIDGETTGQLFIDAMTHLDTQNKYLKLPFIEKGKEFVPGFSGEPFQVYMDPAIDYAFSSRAYNDEGLKQSRTLMVSENKIFENLVSTQYGQYLDLNPTVTDGNVVIEAQAQDRKKLLASEPLVLEILQFSALFSQPRDLTFSSEIRLARVHDNESKEVYYIKGGNLAGNFKESFKRVRFAGEKKLFNLNEISRGPVISNGYHGPEWSLIHDLVLSS